MDAADAADDARRLARYLARWRLVPDGPMLRRANSVLLPVRREVRVAAPGGSPNGRPDGWPERAMLKLARIAEERRGVALLRWWDGVGAARVLVAADDPEGDAVLLERATGGRSLAAMARSGPGGDDAASRVLCATAARLHGRLQAPPTPRPAPPATLVRLDVWFAALGPAAAREGGVLRAAAAAARALLAEPRDVVVLHGDLHHENVLDFDPPSASPGGRGWRAIDPKGLVGERAYEFAPLFCNPTSAVARAPGRLARQAAVVATAAAVDRARLLRWVLAYAGLSAAWSLEDGDDPRTALAVAEAAAATLTAEGLAVVPAE